ncbi:MAG: FG-GAP repeat protein [Ignavibacteria bacterium]|nr:FG-GAP repeat protein [Ignavibacteria bacterium]
MKNISQLFIAIVLTFLLDHEVCANWMKSENGNSIVQIEIAAQDKSSKTIVDSLPAGFTDEILKDLRDNNGNKVFQEQSASPDEEGDAFQQRSFNGSAAGDLYGYSVSSAGDVNGDGFDDLIIGAPNNAAAGVDAGRAYIYFGGINVNGLADVVLSGETAGNYFGISVSSAGDVNGDGYSDVIVGAYGFASDVGRAYVYFGNSIMNNSADVLLTGEANDYLGLSVSGAGDVNGDGYSDVLVGAYGYSSYTGRAHLYFGGSSMNNVEDLTFMGENANNHFGLAVSSAGDLNGDGYSDIVIGAKRYSSFTGRAYVYFGDLSMDNTVDIIFTGDSPGILFGESVSTAEDVNGDGYSDLIISASSYDGGNGRAFVYFGGSAMDDSPDVTMSGTTLTNFGNSVSNAGDVNGDGYSDVIIGEKFAYYSATGRAYIYLGGESMNGIVDHTLTGEGSSNYFGVSVSGAGDVNGDGFSDVIAGAYGFNGSTGKSYLYMYGMNGTIISDLNMSGAAILRELGSSVSTAGDVNADGYDDLIIGAPHSAGGAVAGDAYIFLGGVNMDNIADVSLGGEATNNRFGHSVSHAGDVNGDGFSDVIVGAWGYSSYKGRAYIYYGGVNMNNTADVTLTGVNANDYFGISVSGAGDVNGDGFTDVIVGSEDFSFNSNNGRAYIYYGGTGMNNSADVIMNGDSANYYFGCSVSSAGDVNGDGYFDVIVGARGFRNNTGKAIVFYGGGSMNNVADVTLTGEATDDYFGRSVSSAGDVNGDGFSDAIVGANRAFNGSGRAYIYFGGTVMNISPDVVLTGELPLTYTFGQAVSRAGDINDDGYDDVIVGSSTYNNYTGQAFVFYGGPAMNNVSDIEMTGEGINTSFGNSISSAGDLNGDGHSDLIIGAHQTNNLMGKCFVYFTSSPNVHPNILSVKDVSGDQGGFVNLKFARSAFDVPLSEIGGVNYQIERSLPPNMNGYNWISVATVFGTHNAFYTAEIHTPLDSGISGNNTYFFRITASSNSSASLWRSNILSGYSIDNLAPIPPSNLTAGQSGSNVILNWSQNPETDLRQYNIYRNNILIGTSTTLNYTDNLFSSDSSFVYRIAAEDVHGNISGQSNPATVTLISSTVIVKVIPEGYYISNTDELSAGDTVKAFLHEIVSPFSRIDSAKSFIDPVTLSCSFRFYDAPSGMYYIAVKHRNTIETWSKPGGELITVAATMNYDFTSNSSKAYGNNMVQVDATPVRFAIYSGDVNQDGTVDATDVSAIDNDASNFVGGYVATDLTGDDFVDGTDFAIADNNAANFVSTVRP